MGCPRTGEGQCDSWMLSPSVVGVGVRTCELTLKPKTGTKDSRHAVTPSFVVEQIQTQWHLPRYLKVPGENVSTWAELAVQTATMVCIG